jgi:hypothetical protein
MRMKISELRGLECALYHEIGRLLRNKPLPLAGMVLSRLLAEAIIADCDPAKRVQVRDAIFSYIDWTTRKLNPGDISLPRSH